MRLNRLASLMVAGAVAVLGVCPGRAAIPAATPRVTDVHGDDELSRALRAEAHTGVQSGGLAADLMSGKVFEVMMFVLERGWRLELGLDGGVGDHGTLVVAARTSSTAEREAIRESSQRTELDESCLYVTPLPDSIVSTDSTPPPSVLLLQALVLS